MNISPKQDYYRMWCPRLWLAAVHSPPNHTHPAIWWQNSLRRPSPYTQSRIYDWANADLKMHYSIEIQHISFVFFFFKIWCVFFLLHFFGFVWVKTDLRIKIRWNNIYTTVVRLIFFWLFYLNLCNLISINMISYNFTIWNFIKI